MALGRHNLALASVLVISGCLDHPQKHATRNTDAAMPSEDAGPQDGATALDAGDAGGAVCALRTEQVDRVVASVVAQHLSCASAADCRVANTETLCDSCGIAAVNADGIASVNAAVAAANAGACKDFERKGCKVGLPCELPAFHVDCVARQCALVSELSDAGATDQCATGDLSWGWIGGLVAYAETDSLMPCRTFKAQRTSVAVPGSDLTCENQVTGDAKVNMTDVNARVLDAAVLNTLATTPTVYGQDTRPSDGAVFLIEHAGKSVLIGEDCGSQAGCVPIPPALATARATLQALSAQQLLVGTCAAASGH